ncbi:ribose-phosphate diphosphokinase [Patescibacteria group bacterium]|nr:ribose-phosphate diphosphokinase [Patescibacteria group bacterium]
MKNFIIIPTSTAEHLAKGIKSKGKSLEVILPEKNREGKRYFPDGEVYMKISKADKLKGERVVVLHSGAPMPNKGLIELELILEILKDNKVKPEVFFTYFPYSQQDKVFEKGETNVAENLLKKLVSYYKVKKIYIIDPHFGGRNWVKKYPIIGVSAVPYLIKKARRDFDENILFLSPDKGGERRTGFSGIKKKRLTSFKVRTLSPKLNFKGKIVGVVDDIIETGGTLLKFYDFSKKAGAKKIIVLITQGILPAGISKIKKKYSKLYLTNAVKQKEANIDITDLILKTLS